MSAADLGAVHLVARARSRGLRVECAHPEVGLPQGIGVDAGAGAHAAVAATARGASRIAGHPRPLTPSPFGGGGTRGRLVVLAAGGDDAAVAPDVGLDPSHRGTSAVDA